MKMLKLLDNGILAASSQFCKQDLEGLLLWNRVQLKRQVQFWRMDDIKRSGNGDTNVCATPFQFETPKSVLMSSSLIMNDMTSTPEENTSVRAEKCFNDGGQLPLFQTGSGRSVTVSKGSIKRASAFLEPRNIAKELEDEAYLNGGYATSIFKTGIGKSILATENSRERAQFVLEAKEAVKQGYEDCGSPLPMFQTGSGKSVLVSESSVQKARAVLKEEEHYKLVKTDKKIAAFVPPLKTSRARTVNVSSTGVSRAATLLGLEENTLSTQFFGHVSDKLGTKITVKRGNPEHRLDVASTSAISSGTHKGTYPTENPTHMDRHQQFGFSKSTTSDAGEHSIRFSTAGGRSMAISADALQRARSLLGDSDLVVSPNDSIGHSLASATEKLPKSTISPKGDVSNLSHGTRAIGYAVPDAPLTKKSANQFHMGREYRPINEIPKVPKPPSRCLSEGNNVSNAKDKTQWHHMPAGPLVDITNYMATCSGNTDRLANGKRIIGGRNSISPFKRPRSSRFIMPIKNNKLSSAGESIVPPMQISPCRTMLSARYPFQHQRKNYKEYFGGPPCFKYLTEHVTDDVKLMDARRAEKFRFQHTDIGAEEFQKMLLTCGASLSCATKEYSLDASLDITLLEQLEKRKLFVGQKLRIWGASLCGWSGPVSFHEVPGIVKLAVHINGTYRARWNDTLGFCKHVGLPLAFRCIKASGGRVPRTLVGITRIYPVLYRERLPDGRSVVRSERMERKALELYHQRYHLCSTAPPTRPRWTWARDSSRWMACGAVSCSATASTSSASNSGSTSCSAQNVAIRRVGSSSSTYARVSKITEDILFEQQENCHSTDDNEEGAKIFNMLEHAAEPEFILAGMAPEQLKLFSSYIEKREIVKQNEVSKMVEKALEVAGLSKRDVTPFLKVRVIGLVNKHSASTSSNKEGLITIWNPTEMQKHNLVEGQAYSVMGLVPSNYCTEILYLHARGSSTTWKPLASAQTTDFKPFFTPRKAIELLKFGEVPISSEFDIAGLILYVGNTYLCSNKKKQWLFLTDGSKFISEQGCEEQDCLLAVSISSAPTDEDSALFSYTLSGNTVGFSNLVKRQKDETRQIWVAEATENSSYTLSNEIPRKSHLKEAAAAAERWASRSYHKIQELKERILCIVGNAGV
ncbi:protein BREAST CANCER SUSCEPTIBILITY 2 homolog A-like isoform X9 [Miscanthus floridulus]|uniref:protein BREAST CANCER SUSCEPTIBILITY 2 homolog A-like isoform X9 n=1 Tax=Miscanthus floridulus TaxID=154761 RepID=UPI00345B09DE